VLELEVARDAAHAAGQLLAGLFLQGVQIEHKGDRDLVSVADREAEALIRDRIAAAFPDDLVVGEEGEDVTRAAAAGRRRWYVDPLDGTTNFLKGRRWWGVAIGFCDADDAMRAAVVHLPCWDETFAAARGGGATCNGAPIRCSRVTRLRDALVTSGFSGTDGGNNVDRWGRVLREALAVRANGAIAPDLCAVARGTSDGLWTLRAGPWDVAAGMLIAAEAGAAVTDLEGTPVAGPVQALIVAAPGIADALRDLIR
jgi:myo-inositol-1(or 4)-monophosphatase